jgi:hypothetical protein
MSYFKFKENDLFVNTIETYPDVKFYIQSGSIYIDDKNYISGSFSDNILGVPRGFVSLYEYNVNRDENQKIYPYLIKDGNKSTFKSISDVDYNTLYNYDGSVITSSYNMSASITRYLVSSVGSVTTTPLATSTTRLDSFYLRALRNTINYYRYLSPYYDFERYYTEQTNLITVPSIFYGSSIRKGSVNLKYYISGTLAAQASDYRYNGELVQVSGTTTGEVVGTVLYKEGFILLTASATIDNTVLNYESATTSSWIRFGFGANDGGTIATSTLSASYSLEFQGVNHTQTMTMLTKAPYYELNHSNNPTYLQNSAASLRQNSSGSAGYSETPRIIKNIVPVNYTDADPPMEKETYISKIAIYDKDRNVIGFAKLATPVRKTEDREFIFKLKLDL